MRTRTLIVAAMLAGSFVAALVVPHAAFAATWIEGTAARPFSLASSGGLIVTTDTADPSLVVPYAAQTLYDGTAIEFEPRSIALLPDGSMLVTCGKHGTIVVVSSAGRLVRQLTGTDIPGLQRPFDARPTSDGGMLIVDRAEVQGEGRVFRVDGANNVVWHYGGTSGMGAGQVFDPFTAEQLPGGHTLIADSLGYRVIEVDDATGDIVWSYGEFKVAGSDAGHLNRPHSAQRLSNGNTLICDSENQRVIEVDRSKAVVWSYGTGTSGAGPGQLANPNSATRLANGNTLIADSDNARVLEVDRAGAIVQAFGTGGMTPAGGSLSDPRAALRMADGSTLIADLGHMRLAGYGFPVRREYIATSSAIDPLPGVRKRFVAISVGSSTPGGSLLAVEYSINSGAWTDLLGAALPSDAIGTSIQYRLRVTTGTGFELAPVVRDVTIEWVVAGSSSSGSSGSGTGTHASAGGSGTRAGTGTGIGTTTVPGGTSELPEGTADGSAGSGGQAVGMSSTVSGWVMSEVKNDVADFGSVDGFGTGGRTSSDPAVPAVGVLLAMYATGIAWSPVSRLTSTLVARIATTIQPK